MHVDTLGVSQSNYLFVMKLVLKENFLVIMTFLRQTPVYNSQFSPFPKVELL